MIAVTKTFLPPIEDYNAQLKRSWDKHWLTNRGPLVLELEEKLKHYLKIKNIIATTNGTIPLQIALKLFGKGGEVITTPFSYIATTSAIVWENCTPVFVDIHPDYLTIDESKIEDAITDKTTAILVTHVFGNPCAVEAIEAIGKKYQLKIIYDAAHSFGVTYKNKSIFNYGDVSSCSFHATKLFHTGEGGALFSNDDEIHHQLFYSHNFGHNGPHDFFGVGINAKMSELQGAMGLAVLPFMDAILEQRKEVVSFYNQHINFSTLKTITIREHTHWNYSYYPVIFESEQQLIQVQAALNQCQIFPRRYFYPSLNTLPFVAQKPMPVSEQIAACVLCLPLYAGLTNNEMQTIVNGLNNALQ